MLKKIKPYVISILIALAVGALSAFITMDNMDIYSEIAVPPLAPPGFLFPIVWTILYVLMGISSARVYTLAETNPALSKNALTVYAMSLAANFIWSPIFFNIRAFLVAFVVILLLLFLIIRTIMLYRGISPLAAYLQIPYLLWVSFATYLNFGIWFLNI